MYNQQLKEDTILEKTLTLLIDKVLQEMNTDNFESKQREIGAYQQKREAARQRIHPSERVMPMTWEYSLPTNLYLR